MKIKIDIDSKYEEIELHICHNKHNDETRSLFSDLNELFLDNLVAYDDTKSVMIKPMQIVRIYSANKQVYISTEEKTYRIKERLYELEELLPAKHFVRISNSEIVNINKIIRLDTSLAGTILMYLKGDIQTYVSRRNVSRIKKALGI